MTIEEAEKVVKILARADGGCSGCVCSLLKKFKAAFPDFSVEQIHGWLGGDWSLEGLRDELED